MAWSFSGAVAIRSKRRSHAGAPSATVHISPASGAEFRGTFRDFTLWVDAASTPVDSSADSRLWVVEYASAEELSSERSRADAGGLKVILQEKQSLVMQGDVPGVLGYDACGGEVNKTVISVATREVLTVPMSATEAGTHLEQAQSADPWIETLLEKTSQSSITESITKLQSYTSRNSASGSAGLDPAADWASQQFTNAGFQVTRDTFRNGYTPQIVAELRGTESPEKIVVLGAHLDSTAGWSSRPTSRAPGADDNGSGSSSVLEFARIIASTGARFKNTLRLCLFTGEEQGLIGSRALASRWRDERVNIIAMINVDMMGYRRSGTPINIVVMTRASDPALTNIARATASTYLPSYANANTSGCCSDQQSFHENGFPSVGFFESPGSSVAYPQYHTSSDLLQYIDTRQVTVQAKAAFATTAVMAELLPMAPTPAPPPTPPSPTPPTPTPPSPTPPSPTPPTGSCEHQTDCNVNPWCRSTGYEEWCRQQGLSGACPAPFCKRT